MYAKLRLAAREIRRSGSKTSLVFDSLLMFRTRSVSAMLSREGVVICVLNETLH